MNDGAVAVAKLHLVVELPARAGLRLVAAASRWVCLSNESHRYASIHIATRQGSTSLDRCATSGLSGVSGVQFPPTAFHLFNLSIHRLVNLDTPLAIYLS